MKSKFYITTAIAYVNAPPHMGHALEFVQADAIARYKRMTGHDVYFLTGTDEHGVKIYNTAKKEGIETLALVDRNAQHFKDLKNLLNLSYDDFIRTSDRKRHWPSCEKLWMKLVEKGDIYEKEYEGLYCEGCELFMKETELVEGLCPIHKKAPTLLKERNYFFRLSSYSQKIVELIESGTLKLLPESRQAEFLSMAKEGLLDVSFSRPRSVLPWGVTVPTDESQVMYVWCDALTNYISALDYANDGERFRQYWPADLHFIGKDIVRFHAGIWIGMLLSAGIELPKAILIHGFVTHNGEKMSKTLGNVVDPVETAQHYETDTLRYYLLREIPMGKDGDFNDALFIERYNSDLANNLGNLLNRVHTLVTRYELKDFRFDQAHELYQEQVALTWKNYHRSMDDYRLHEAISHVWRLVDFANKRMEEEKPWSLMKADTVKGSAVLSSLLEILRQITMLLAPFLPATSQTMRKQLGLLPTFDLMQEGKWGEGTDWHTLGMAQIIFPRLEA